MLNYQPNTNIYATGKIYIGTQDLTVHLSGNYKQNSHLPFDFTIWSDIPDQGRLFDVAMRYPGITWFEGVTEHNKHIWIMGIEVRRLTGYNRLEGSAALYIEGDYNLTPEGRSKVNIKAILSPTPIILADFTQSLNYDGTITKVTEKPDRYIEWKSLKGLAKLNHEYEYLSLERQVESGLFQIRKNILHYLYSPSDEISFKSILTKFPNWIVDDLLLLSLLGRRRTICYETSAWGQVNEQQIHAFARYKTWQGFYSIPTDDSFLRCIIQPGLLKDGLFDFLYKNYINSKYKGVISKAITHLLVTYEDGYIESQLISAYAALESMVDGISEIEGMSYTIGSNPFKRLCKDIEELINSHVEDPKSRERIMKKLPELRRQPFLERLFDLLEKQKVDMDPIWPKGVDKRSEFSALLSRRNALIHKGQFGNPQVTNFDLSRIQRLVELWILKLLDTPNEAINTYGLWYDVPINEILHY